MGGGIRYLRKPVEWGPFGYRRPRLNEREAQAVRLVVNELRKAEDLPGEEDVPDLIEPALHCFARAVPGFALWVSYLAPSPDRLDLIAIKTQMLRPL